MSEPTQPSEEDLEKISSASKLIIDLIFLNPGIERNIWASALWNILMAIYRKEGVDYTGFCHQIEVVKKGYGKALESQYKNKDE